MTYKEKVEAVLAKMGVKSYEVGDKDPDSPRIFGWAYLNTKTGMFWIMSPQGWAKISDLDVGDKLSDPQP